tara:strand:- start:2 stop:562 length:561 start_codon:yes stop_codon:yes gene_type:complete
MLRYSVYYKAFNKLYSNPISCLDKLDENITNSFLQDISSSFTTNILDTKYGVDLLIDTLYPPECNPYDINHNKNGNINQIKNLNIINKIIAFYEQLQLQFNYKSLDKCGCYIILKKYTNNYNSISCNDGISNNNKISMGVSHDYFVYLHKSILDKQKPYFVKLLDIAGKIQIYIYNMYKQRNCLYL